MSTVFAIAQKARRSAGQGAEFVALQIVRRGAYEHGAWHPLFVERRKAEDYLAALTRDYVEFEIVELELR